MDTITNTVIPPEELAAIMERLMSAFPAGVKITTEAGVQDLSTIKTKPKLRGLVAICGERQRMRPGVIEYGDAHFEFNYRGLTDKESNDLDKIDDITPPEKTVFEQGKPVKTANFEDPTYKAASAKAVRRKMAAMIEKATDLEFPGTSLEEKGQWLEDNMAASLINAIVSHIRSLSSNVLAKVDLS